MRTRGSYGARGKCQRKEGEFSGHNESGGEKNSRGGFKIIIRRGRFNGSKLGSNTFLVVVTVVTSLTR